MSSAPYKLWTKRLAMYSSGESIPESHINALCALVRGTKRSALSAEETMEIVDRVDANPNGIATVRRPLGWKITPEQSEKGLRWMQSTGMKDLRKGYSGSRKMKAAVEALESFSHWTFDGLFIFDHGYGRMDARPVYTMHGTNGASLSYCAYPWQSGKLIEVLECEAAHV